MNKKIYLSLIMLLVCCTAGLFGGKIHDAVKNQNLELVKQLIKEDPTCIHDVDEYKNTSLLLACYNNNLEMVTLLLDNSAKETINMTNNNGALPLLLACHNNNLEIIKLLLDNGAKETINKPDNKGLTPLYLACANNNLEMVKLLLDNGAKETINKPDNAGYTPLHWACIKNNLEIVTLLLPHYTKETINKAGKNGKTLLHWACQNYKNIEIIRILLEHGASPGKFDNSGFSPLCFACISNQLEPAKLVISYCTKEIINTVDNEGRTTLHKACNMGKNPQIIKLLLENGADFNLVDNNGDTPLLVACVNDIEMVKPLLNNGAKETINIANKDSITPLFIACLKNNLEMVKLLFAHGAQKIINIANKNNITPLFIACAHGNLEIITLFLLYGANITQKEINKASQITKPYLLTTQTYNNPQKTNKEKIKYIMSVQKKDKDNKLFNFLIKLCFVKSLENMIKNGATLGSTIFYRVYTEKKIKLEDVFGIKKMKTCLDFIKQVIKAKNCEFYFAKQYKFEKDTCINKIWEKKLSNNLSDTIIHVKK